MFLTTTNQATAPPKAGREGYMSSAEGQKRGRKFQVRLSEMELEMLELAAARLGLSVSAFIRTTAIQQAREELSKEE
jgi:uncharacterized protein (DUF1778 family)